jgi:hypothetical protein
VTLLELLSAFGSPAQVAAWADQARALMRRVGRVWLSDETIEQVIQSATATVGMPCVVSQIISPVISHIDSGAIEGDFSH